MRNLAADTVNRPKSNTDRLLLFRKEALDAVAHYHLVEPIHESPTAQNFSIILGLFFFASMGLIALGYQTTLIRLQGTILLSPPFVTIHAPQDGIVKIVHAGVGSKILSGEEAISLDLRYSDVAQMNGKRQNEIRSLKQKVVQLTQKRKDQSDAYALRLNDIAQTKTALHAQIASNSAQVEALRHAAELLSTKRDNVRKLARSEAVSAQVSRESEIQYERSNSEFFERQTALHALEQSFTEKEQEGSLADEEHKQSLIQIDAELEQLELAIAHLKEVTTLSIPSPIDGEVSYVDVRKGDVVSSGTSIMLVKPSHQMARAIFPVPSNLIEILHLSSSSIVTVVIDTKSGRRSAKGAITSISPAPFGFSNSAYKLIVTLEEASGPYSEGVDAILSLEGSRSIVLKELIGL